MKHLSLLTALMLSSSMVYAGWLTEDYKGDCLEMMCDCVEKDGIGYCCPSGTSFNGKGDAHIEYTPCKCLGANTYYNTTSQKCLSKPTCNPCQKLNVATGTCVADTSKNNQAVGACGKCNNGSVITDTTKETVCKTCNTTNWTLMNKANGQAVGTCGKCNNGSVVTDTTKVTPCKTCNTTNWTLTNRANETQVQDVCHICKNGNVVLKDSTKQFISNNTCVECLADYGTGKSGACTTSQKPQCKNNTCQACPSGYNWNNSKKDCVKLTCANLGKGNGLRLVNTWGDKCNRTAVSYIYDSKFTLGPAHGDSKTCNVPMNGYLYYASDKSFKNVTVAKHVRNNRGSASVDGKSLLRSQDFVFQGGKFYSFSAQNGGGHYVVSQIEIDLTKIKPDLLCY
ncbi:MAG: hypothetical protein E7021_03195 [Alphaproteobacteria bacterium]|nr:hypothetical protein [Alphaproteobacteria bacterium]